MKKYIRILKWLIKNQDELQKLIDKEPTTKKEEQRFSLAGVPEYQLKYIDDKLKDESVK